MFDLILYPFSFSAGREQDDLPGLQAAAAPRRSERHRAGDQIILMLSAPGGQTLPGNLPAEALQTLAKAYYSTGGTVTSAVRAAIEALNISLLNRKSQPGEAGPSAAILNLAVVRGNSVYVVHAGPTHTFVLTHSVVHHFSDPLGAGRGLGAAQTVGLRFFQAEIEPGDLLLFSPDAPASWTPASLSGSPQLDPEALRRRLLNQAPPDLSAGLVRLQAGSGKISRSSLARAAELQPAAPLPAAPAVPEPPAITPGPTAASEETPPAAHPTPSAPPVTAAIPLPTPAVSSPQSPAALAEENVPSGGEIIPDDAVAHEARRRIAERRARAGSSASAQPQRPPQPETRSIFARLFQRKPRAAPQAENAALQPTTQAVMPAPTPVRARRPWLKGLAAIFRGTRTAQRRAGAGLGRFLPRLLPTTTERSASISPATMFFIAIAVPVIVVAIGTTVYLRSGAGEQRVAYLQQARVYADQANKQKDPALKRSSWTQVIYWVKKAEEFGSDDESAALRFKAQVALDSMDGIVRLSLAPAFTGVLGSGINITRMDANLTDLYLLDSNQGRVMHMTLAGRSYEYDPSFVCGPGPSGGKIIGPLVGMSVLPPNNDIGAAVLAVDATGDLLYCKNGDPSPLAAVLSPPENNWGKISAMTMYNGNLYVLDVQNNAVWRFDGDNLNFTGRPRLFFGNEVPNLSDVIDITMYQDDLYMLRSSGKMTVCTYSSFDFSPTRCNDPASYGSRNATVLSFSDASFTQMQTTQPPDPSLFILDVKGQAIYHFSLRLNYQRQLRQDPQSDFPLPQKAVTAFTIAPNRVIFLAFGNQIFFGALP